MAILDDNMIDARCRLLSLHPWYGTMASYMTWKERAEIKTLGVVVNSNGTVTCYYSPDFCKQLSIQQLMACIQHEIEHIVLLHCVRVGSRNRKLWNIATDMIINGRFNRPNIDMINKLPIKVHHYPDEWQENLTSEEVYDRLEQNKVVVLIHLPGGGTSTQSIHDGGGSETIVVEGEEVGDHDVWNESEAGEEEARQIIKDMVQQAADQVGAGKVPGHLIDSIKKLDDPVRNWRYEFRLVVGRTLGGKRTTYSRQNRRRREFGVPGKSSHANTPLTLCIDTSASVDSVRLEQFMAELESMSQHFRVTLVQFDHGYQCHQQYHKGDWQDIQILGRGGTSFIELFKALDEKELFGKLTIICSDGDAPWPEPQSRNILWVIFPHNPENPPVPTWGNTIYIGKA